VDLVSVELLATTLVVAIEPGMVSNRILLASGERGLIADPVSLAVGREGIERLCRMVEDSGAGAPVRQEQEGQPGQEGGVPLRF
jgi:hypothetical protein